MILTLLAVPAARAERERPLDELRVGGARPTSVSREAPLSLHFVFALFNEVCGVDIQERQILE